MTIICHNNFGTFRGETAGEVLRKIHAEAARDDPHPCSFEEWKSYNVKLWTLRYDIDVPSGSDPESEAGFLKVLYDVGAVDPGQKPQQVSANKCGLEDE